jgi:predicted DNA binding CopG/RHH family protein
MPAKKVSIGRKPGAEEKPIGIEEWVANREELQAAAPSTENQPEKMKRLTLDIPEKLHRAIKRQAVDEGVTMADLLRSLLEQHYGSSS